MIISVLGGIKRVRFAKDEDSLVVTPQPSLEVPRKGRSRTAQASGSSKAKTSQLPVTASGDKNVFTSQGYRFKLTPSNQRYHIGKEDYKKTGGQLIGDDEFDHRNEVSIKVCALRLVFTGHKSIYDYWQTMIELDPQWLANSEEWNGYLMK